MDFDAAGSVRGNAGCNTYSASYQAAGNTLSVTPSITTNMACESPAGVMQQEQQFLAALQSAATFQLTGNQLQIRSGGDALAIMANRAP
jgi:heat shock protein HslJ